MFHLEPFGIEHPSPNHARTTVKSEKKECDDGGLSTFHYEFNSCKPVNLIRAIDLENSVLLDKPIRCTGSQYETG
jgi:hypothetical protein